MATPKGAVRQLLERAHPPDAAAEIFADRIQYRPLFLRPTSPPPEAQVSAAGVDGREARRRARRRKQEQRRTRQPKPKPLSARQRRKLGLYDLPTSKNSLGSSDKLRGQSYATFLPLHRLWLGYIREVLGPADLRAGGAGAAAKLTAADFHGAAIEVTRSACVGRVGLRGIVVRDTRFVFELVTPDNRVKMVPKEGTFFRVAIPLEGDGEAAPKTDDPDQQPQIATTDTPNLVFEIVGSQFQHRAIDRANRKFKQHFYKEL